MGGGGGRDQGIKVTSYLDSPHMLSQYLLIHSEAIKAKKGGGGVYLKKLFLIM